MFDTCKTTKSVNYCYESMIARALAHIVKVGIPDECPQDCDIYYGPKKSVFVGYHSVDIVAIEIFKGQLVAPCKMSNDTKIVNQGYVRTVHPTLRSHHLLSDFCCVIWMRLKEETSSGN
ncbi:hypothetical protein IGI04_032625 [Brassica rapa subsp. trilocularis]|uniref:Uncharacterized protein n=1 Tax=Brassica rapa subsp. trilocularis TaxID=1813537 RepID=A0ABQ7LWZ5_BRACM|nr:hypothetical protein IGI04_032625 [Brassica rapa subsp. trilocularis]